MPNKALNLRLPEAKVAELAAIAHADGVHVSDAVREAIDNHIAARQAAGALRPGPDPQTAAAAGISSRDSR